MKEQQLSLEQLETRLETLKKEYKSNFNFLYNIAPLDNVQIDFDIKTLADTARDAEITWYINTEQSANQLRKVLEMIVSYLAEKENIQQNKLPDDKYNKNQIIVQYYYDKKTKTLKKNTFQHTSDIYATGTQINYLYDRRIITQKLCCTLHEIREIGNVASHAQSGHFQKNTPTPLEMNKAFSNMLKQIHGLLKTFITKNQWIPYDEFPDFHPPYRPSAELLDTRAAYNEAKYQAEEASSKDNQIHALNKKINELTQEINKQKREKEQLEKQLHSQDNIQNNNLQETIAQLEQHAKNREAEFQAAFNLQQQENEKLNQQIKNIEQQSNQHETALNQQKQDNENLIEQINFLHLQLAESEIELQAACNSQIPKVELEQIQAALKNQEEKNIDLVKKIQELEQQAKNREAELQAVLKNHEHKNIDLKKKIQELEQHAKKYETELQAALKNHKHENRDLNKTIQELEQHAKNREAELQAALNNQQQQIDKFKQDNTHLYQENQKLKKQKQAYSDELQKTLENYEKMQNDLPNINNLIQDNSRLSNQVNSLEKEVNQQKEKLQAASQLEKQVDNLKEEAKRLKDEITALSTQITSSQTDMEIALQKQNELINERDSLKEQNQLIQNKLQDTESKMKNWRDKFDNLEKECYTLQKALANYEITVDIPDYEELGDEFEVSEINYKLHAKISNDKTVIAMINNHGQKVEIPAMESGMILQYHVQQGNRLKRGDKLFTIRKNIVK